MLGVVGDSATGKTTLTEDSSAPLARERSRTLPPRTTTNLTAVGALSWASRRCTRTATTSTSWPSTSRSSEPGSRSASRPIATPMARSGHPRTCSHVGSRWSKESSAITRPSCETATTCGFISHRRRDYGGGGRSSGTASNGGTPPIRCSPSSIGARLMRTCSSGRSRSTQTSSSPSRPATRARSSPECPVNRWPDDHAATFLRWFVSRSSVLAGGGSSPSSARSSVSW